MRAFYVYILTTRKDGPFYVGVTNDPFRRMQEHRGHPVGSHVWRYNIDRLVYFEQHATAGAAIAREKRLKRWRRAWKVELIEEQNPEWADLSQTLIPQLNDGPGSSLRCGRDDG